jgi:hypothetical protein
VKSASSSGPAEYSCRTTSCHCAGSIGGNIASPSTERLRYHPPCGSNRAAVPCDDTKSAGNAGRAAPGESCSRRRSLPDWAPHRLDRPRIQRQKRIVAAPVRRRTQPQRMLCPPPLLFGTARHRGIGKIGSGRNGGPGNRRARNQVAGTPVRLLLCRRSRARSGSPVRSPKDRHQGSAPRLCRTGVTSSGQDEATRGPR